MFYMNMCILNEGEQAEAYKKRKSEEDIESERGKNYDRKNQLGINIYDGRHYTYTPKPEKYVDGKGWVYRAEENGVDHEKARQYAKKREYNAIKATNIAARELERREKDNDPKTFDGYRYMYHNYDIAMDAVAKHLRKHPEKLKEDCGIFESIEII